MFAQIQLASPTTTNTAFGDETYTTSSETVGNASTESAAKHLGHNPRPLTMYKAMLTCGNEPDATSAAFTKTPVFSNLLLKIP